MRQFVRLCIGECYKTKHTIIPALHIGIPLVGSVALLLYHHFSKVETMVQLSTFSQLIGLAFPFIVFSKKEGMQFYSVMHAFFLLYKIF